MVGAPDPPNGYRDGGAARLARAACIAAWGALVLPAVATIGAPVHAPVWHGLVGVGIACAVATAIALVRPPGTGSLALVGVAIVAIACWLLVQSSYPVAAWLVAPLLGMGLALAIDQPADVSTLWGRQSVAVAGFAVAVVVVGIVATRAAAGRDASMAAAAAIVAAAGVAAVLVNGPKARAWRRGGRLAGVAAVLALMTTAYIGATTPSVTWFGSLVVHGPRGSDEVALTFDDGPNPPYTLEISAILDRYEVKGTFFTVGKALEARPDVSKALMDDGHLLGNHSYRHDAVRWLDPRYPELDETQEAFKRTLGVCPALFRPPHGSHTPFMARAVSDRGMKMVTWDVSAGDWATTDGQLVARRVLDHVKGGSIILLHDGIDGDPGADRSVILTALPLILSGLRDRGLKAVRLDTLLDVPGYLASC